MRRVCGTCQKSCVKFAGAKPGFAFKAGERGVGYYPDSGGYAPNAKESEPRGLGIGSGGRVLLLEALVPQSAERSPPCKKGRRKHGPRGSRPKFAEIVTFNSSGKPQLKDALRMFQPKKDEDGTERREVAALCCQEHHAAGDGWTDLQHAARKLNWVMQGAPAVPGKGHSGCSGAGIAAKRHIGLAPPADRESFDISPVASPGKLAAAWIDGVLRGGVLVISVYLWNVEGATERNLEILRAAGEEAVRYGGPWIIAGDFNMTPDEFRDDPGAAAWLKQMRGTIAAPDTITCRSSATVKARKTMMSTDLGRAIADGNLGKLKCMGHDSIEAARRQMEAEMNPAGGRIIDYFIVDRRIAHAVLSVKVCLDLASSPHNAVVLRLRCTATRDLVRMLRRPRTLPARRPIGCRRRTESPSETILARLASATEGDIDGLCRVLYHAAETELCGLCDQVTPQGQPDSRYTGRGQTKETVWKRIVPPSLPLLGRSAATAGGLQWLAIRLPEISAILKRAGAASTPASIKVCAHRAALLSQLRVPTGHLRDLLLAPESLIWKARVNVLVETGLHPDLNADAIRGWSIEARCAARVQSRQAAQDSLKGWWKFVDDQLRAGAGALHKLAKRQPTAADAAPRDNEGRTMDPQRVVNVECEAWKRIWHKFNGVSAAPWRVREGGDSGRLGLADHEQLPPIAGEQLREAADTYKEHTGRGCDAFHPKWFAWLSDELLAAFALLLMSLEKLGVWPSQISAILIALIPKNSGGTRPIGLLAALVRLWERVRKPIVAEWRRTVERSYNLAAKGKSPQAAVWRLALRTEAARARGEESAAAST